MKEPDICTTLIDSDDNVTYHVIAYRKLSQEETITTIRGYLSSESRRRKPAPKPGSVVKIITVIGLLPGL